MKLHLVEKCGKKRVQNDGFIFVDGDNENV